MRGEGKTLPAFPCSLSSRACRGRRPRRPAVSRHRSVCGAIRGSLPTRTFFSFHSAERRPASPRLFRRALLGAMGICIPLPQFANWGPPLGEGGACADPHRRSVLLRRGDLRSPDPSRVATPSRACRGQRPRRPAASRHHSIYGAIRGSLPTRAFFSCHSAERCPASPCIFRRAMLGATGI